ncbi:Heavy-metal resistance protein CzcE [Duganella sacchari]|uniref:Heavy-metal resistance protein CzcE n=1 Tax=Duganella sacchari TaxID=551987 RepID=A0A1M7INJ0_9BURK|nr:CzcE family metal-binding protein [Duganella sacchari]SHM42148.1 Heavy-metal resistance protein CzcE [Duganella sacchari]
MFNALRTTLIAAAIAASTGAAHATVNPHPEFGMRTAAANADQRITINPSTKWVNVNNGDTVTFDINGKSVTWHFDTLHSEEAFDLSKIAPDAIPAGVVTVYVGSNPLYRG